MNKIKSFLTFLLLASALCAAPIKLKYTELVAVQAVQYLPAANFPALTGDITTATGTVDLKDSSGTVYHVLVHN